MGMFDYYETDESEVCPYCHYPLEGWQSKEGPCGLLVWRQGFKHPIEQRVDKEIRWSDEELKRFILPDRFRIGHGKAHCRWCPMWADCFTENGVWTQTKLIFLSDAPMLDDGFL